MKHFHKRRTCKIFSLEFVIINCKVIQYFKIIITLNSQGLSTSVKFLNFFIMLCCHVVMSACTKEVVKTPCTNHSDEP